MLVPSELAIHNNFTTSINSLRKDLIRTAYYLLQIQNRMIHKKMGFATLEDYAKHYSGLTPSQTREFVLVGRKLPRFPEVETALGEGRLSWSQARLITRRASPEEQKKWVEQAQSLTVQQMEKILPPVRKRRQGISDKKEPAGGGFFEPKKEDSPVVNRRHFFSLSFESEAFARFERLLAAASGRSKEEKILRALAAGGGQSHGVPYLVVIMKCPECGCAALPTSRGEDPASNALLKSAQCDAAIEDAHGVRRHTIPPKLRRLALQRARFQCEAKGCNHSQFLEIHHRLPTAAGGTNDLSNLMVLCWRCHRHLHEDEEIARADLRGVPV